MQEEASLSLEEQIALKNVLFSFIQRVSGERTSKSGAEIAILPQMIDITVRLFHPYPAPSR